MCITAVIRDKRKVCVNGTSDGENSFLSGLFGDYIANMDGCGGDRGDFNFLLSEYDTSNNFHSIKLNTTVDVSSIDISEYDFVNTIWISKSASEIAIKTALFAPVTIIGILLNVVILLTIYKNKWLWTPSNFLVANMALVDTVTLILGPWMLLVHDSFQNYQLGRVGCRLEGFLQGALLVTGVFAVLLVSYDRLASVVLPAEARVTRRAAPRLAVAVWLFGALVALPLSIYRVYRERQWRDFLEIYCTENIKVLPVYWHVMLAALVWCPLACVAITYAAIIWRLEGGAWRRDAGCAASKARARAVKVAALVLLAFIACRLPFTALVYWRSRLRESLTINATDGAFNMMWFAAHYLIYLNCAINPLIYGFSNQRFLRAMDRTPGIAWCRFGTWCCCAPQIIKSGKKKADPSIVVTTTKSNNKIVTAVRKFLVKKPKAADTTQSIIPGTPVNIQVMQKSPPDILTA